jgi:hypothetical protein
MMACKRRPRTYLTEQKTDLCDIVYYLKMLGDEQLI